MPVLAFLVGSSVASFLNVVADRVPEGKSLLAPPSHCPGCNRRLRPWELVPVFSYLALRGRCRVCGARIPVRVPLMEAAGGLLFAGLVVGYDLSVDALLLAVAGSFLLLVTVIDLERKLVLNVVLLAALPLALLAAPFWSDDLRDPVWSVSSFEVSALLDALAAGAAGLGGFVLLAVAVRGGMGWGDVKLASVIGVWVGLRGLPVAVMVAVMVGGLVALGLLVSRRTQRRSAIPFGPFLALGAMTALLWGEELTSAYLDLVS